MSARWVANGAVARQPSETDPGSARPGEAGLAETGPAETGPAKTGPEQAPSAAEADIPGDPDASPAGSGSGGYRPGDYALRVEHPGVPRWLYIGSSWTWRLILLGFALYLVGRVASVLYVVVVPCTAALLLTALLQPLAGRLRRVGFGNLAATWTALLFAIIVLAGVGALVTERVQAEYPALVPQVKSTSNQVQSWLAGPPFHLHTASIDSVFNNLVRYLSQHRALVEGTVVTGGRIVAEVLAGLVLMLFVSFFLIKDGASIWRWLTSGFSGERRDRVDRAGHAAWQGVVYYIRGTVAVAATHAVVMGIVLSIMSAPLVAPLALLMFIAAFVPLVGALVAGALAIVVVLAAKGWIMALVVLAVLIIMNQLEGHLLQPQIVGKMVHLHPLAVILVLAVGAVVAGIYGAIIAVPITAAVTRGMAALRGEHSATAPPSTAPPSGAPPTPARSPETPSSAVQLPDTGRRAP